MGNVSRKDLDAEVAKRVFLVSESCRTMHRSHTQHILLSFEYDRAGTVLALEIQYSRRHVRKELRGESFHVLESSQVLIPRVLV